MSLTPSASYQESLLACYNEQAVAFWHTRKKPRPEISHLMSIVEKTTVWHFIDVGCGTGRLYETVRTLPGISYKGIDAAKSMISVAREQYPDAQFEHTDMYTYFFRQPQESVDTIVALASFHHLTDAQARRMVLSHMYKSLRRWGRCVLYNRSYSLRFLQQYRKNVVAARGRSLVPWGPLRRNDVLIPWKAIEKWTDKRVYHRLYHLFTLSELEQLAHLTGFCIDSVGYISQTGKTTRDRTVSRNSYIVLRKDIL